MRMILTISALLFTFACAKEAPTPTPPRPAPCTATRYEDGVLIQCPGGKSTVIFDGQRGPAGPQGESCTVTDTADGAQLTCPDGTSQEIHDGEMGPKGDPGESIVGPKGDPGDSIVGPKGDSGEDGFSTLIDTSTDAPTCAAGGTTLFFGKDTNRSGTLDIAEITQSATICNGTDGAPAAATPFTPTELIDPCGDAPGIFDEVFIRLSNGTLIASISDNASGKNTRLGALVAGTWETTDGSHCVFTVHTDLSVSF